MTAQSIVCGACAAEVPNGRLSCPSCGELLASVAGSRRTPASARARSAVPDVLYEPPAAPTPAVVNGDVSRAAPSVRDAEDGLPWGEPTATRAPAGAVAATIGNGAGAADGLLDDEATGLPSWTPSSSTVC